MNAKPKPEWSTADQLRYHRANLERLKQHIEIDLLVVRSMPFGDLVNDVTLEKYAHAANPDIAYGLASAVKGFELALELLDGRTDDVG